MERVIVYDKDKEFVQILTDRIHDDVNDIIIENYTDIDSLRAALIQNVDKYIFSIIEIDTHEDHCDEVIELISSQYIPMLVLTTSKNLEFRDDMMLKHPLIDFATKDSSKNFHYITSLILHMRNAQDIKILLVSNSTHDRNYMYDNLLIRYPFDIIDANDKVEVQEAFKENDEIKIMIIDLMPEEVGLELVEDVREFAKKDSLAILAVTSRENSYLAARFLQIGANDFVTKPIEIETFHSRMNVAIETLSLFDKLQQLVNIDYLTNLKNRRYFFEAGHMLFSNAKRGNIKVAVAMMDIDYFKSINDTYGHNVGDIVLKEVAHLLKRSFRSSDLVARVGGEEFALLLVDAETSLIKSILEKFRQAVEDLVIKCDIGSVNVTISIGITEELQDSLEETIKIADDNLYEAKESGRNKIVFK